jgi:two-component system phosphate regulon sensor histidine kinase PhoR
VLKASFLWKLYGGFALLIICTAALVSSLVSRSIVRDSERQLQAALQIAAGMLSDTTLQNSRAPDPALQQRLVQLGEDTGTRLTIIAADGTVLADSMEDAAGMENHLERPEVRQAATAGQGTATRHSTSAGEQMTYFALAVRGAAGGIVGYARSALPQQELDLRLAQVTRAVLLSSLLAAALGLLLAWWLASLLTRPLSALTADARSLAQGVQPGGGISRAQDEIGALSRAMNQMSSDLGERIATIEKDRRQLLAILGGMVEGVIAVDAGERIVHLNAAAGRMLGVTPEELIGTRLWETVRITALVDSVRGAMKELRDVEAELRLHTEARDRVVELYASPLSDGRGEASGAVVVLHDVTPLRKLEAVRRDFVANVSHELKTPLAVVRAVVETLLEEDDMELGMRRKFLLKVDDQSRRLDDLVNDLLSLSKVESREGMQELRPLDLRQPAQAALSTLATQAAAKQIRLDVDLGDEALMVEGDSEALRQALGNLIDNAIKYSPDNGHVWVRAGQDDSHVTVQVGDTGVGIPQPEQDRIFERFYRVDKARSRDVSGTGLGLSIVKHVVANHGGSVTVSSRQGQGSTFTIELPLAGTRV